MTKRMHGMIKIQMVFKKNIQDGERYIRRLFDFTNFFPPFFNKTAEDHFAHEYPDEDDFSDDEEEQRNEWGDETDDADDGDDYY